MPYTPGGGLQEEDENGPQIAPGAPTAPTISGPTVGSTASFGGTTSGNSAAAGDAQSRPQSAGPGTGFVNIDRYLGANQGEGKRIGGIASKQRQEDAQAFDTQASAFREGVQSAKGPIQFGPEEIKSLLPTGKVIKNAPGTWGPDATTVVAPAFSPNLDQGMAAAKAALEQQYGGPTTLDASTGKNKSDELSRLLSNPETAAAKLATMGGPAAMYNPQMSALDQAILRTQSGDLSQIATDQAAENARQGAQKTTLEGMASDKAKSISDAAAAARGGLTGKAGELQAGGPLDMLRAAGLNTIGRVLGDQGMMGATAAPPVTPPVVSQSTVVPTVNAGNSAERYQQREQAKRDKADEREMKRGGNQ